MGSSNRFDTSVGQQYVSQYTPLPFEAMYKVGAGMQQNYDNNLAETYKLNDALSLVPAIHDPQLGLSNLKKKQDLDNEFHPKVEALTAKIMAGDPNAKQELKKLERDWINNPVRQELENSYLNYKAYKEDKTKKGDKYAAYKDAYRGQSLIDENGELKPFRFSGMGEVQDHASEARDQMKDIANWGYDSKNSQIGADGNIYTRDSRGKYIKDTRVWDLANQKAYDFVKTQKGKDFEDLVRYENPNASEQDVHKRVTQYLFNAGSNQIFSDVGGGTTVSTTSITDKKYDEQKQKEQDAYETTFSKMGQQGVANLSEVSKAEPTNSILSKVINFVNPTNQAKGLLNMLKVISPAINTLPQIKKIEEELTKNNNLNEDVLNNHIEKITYEMKQQVGKDQKNFRETYGFQNPIYNQTYTLLDMFGKGKDVETNSDYERAKAVVQRTDPTFNKLTKQQQFNKVKDEMDKFVETSKTNVALVPMDKKELDFKNVQLTNLAGTPTEKTQQLMNLGLSANGKFIDFYTGKETTLADVAGGTEGMKYMGKLENDNQFGPGMNYFQTADGKFYVSPGSLNMQKDNYFNWNLKQVNNKFSQEHEFPLNFDNRRNINQDGTIPKGIPKGSISRDLKTGMLNGVITLSDNDVINLKGNSEDDLKMLFAKNLFDRGYTIEQVKQLGL